MHKSLGDLIVALRTSLLECVAAPGENLTGTVTTQIEQFEGELAKVAGSLIPPEPEDRDSITTFAGAMERVAHAVDAIEAGRCQPIAGMQPAEHSITLAKAAVDLGALALRAMALDYAAPVAQGEQIGADEQLLKVAMPAAEGEQAEELLIKTVLPRELAEGLVVTPEEIGLTLAEFGVDLLALAGVEPADLAKAFPPPKKKKAAAEGEDGTDDEDAEGEDDEDAEGEDDDEDAEFGAEGEDGTSLDNVTKLATAILMELNELAEQMGGAGAPVPAQGDELAAGAGDMAGAEGEGEGSSDPIVGAIEGMQTLAAMIATQSDALQRAVDSETDDEAGDFYEKVAKVAGLAKAYVPRLPVVVGQAEALAKRATELEAALAAAAGERDGLTKQLAAAQEQLTRANGDLAKAADAAGRQLAEPRGLKMAVPGVVVSKEADGGGTDPAAELAAFQELQKRDPERASLQLFSMALRTPSTGPLPGAR